MIRSAPDRGVWSGTYTPDGPRDTLLAQLAPTLHGPPRQFIPVWRPPPGGGGAVLLRPQRKRGALRPAGSSRRARATRDSDVVVAAGLLLIDIDPERPTGCRPRPTARRQRPPGWQATSSSGSQKRGTRGDSRGQRERLSPPRPRGARAPDPGEPGCDLASNSTSSSSAHLGRAFDSDGAVVDTTTYNVSRICKLYGTQSVKGEPTEERPHRRTFVDLSARSRHGPPGRSSPTGDARASSLTEPPPSRGGGRSQGPGRGRLAAVAGGCALGPRSEPPSTART